MNDKVKIGRGIMSYIFPPVGIITYAIEKDNKPKAAKGYLIISLVAIGMIIAGRIIYIQNQKNKEQ